MAYALTAEALLGFGRRFVRAGGTLSVWAPFVDNVGPALLPLIIWPDRCDEIPLAPLGYSSVKLSTLVPQPGEVWILFCYRDSFRSAVGKGTPLRTDGFPLILEWRKGVEDSHLLSTAFHRLADQVREQLGAEGWGLCPAYARFGDKIAFTDTTLFGDDDGDSSSIASAYGALLAGLSSVVSGRRPPFWPFPTLQWDENRRKPRGVAGLAEKLSVAADCGASVVTIAWEQKREALALLKKLKSLEDGGRYGKLTILAVRDDSEPKTLARRIGEGATDRVRIRRMVLGCVAFFAALLVLSLGYWLDWCKEKIEYYADYVERNGVAEGRFPVSSELQVKRGRTYRFHYRGYDSFVPWARKRVLWEMWCVNGKGAIRVDANDYPEHPAVTGFRYRYDARGHVSEVERYVAGGVVLNIIRYSGAHAEMADVIRLNAGRVVSGGMRFTGAKTGDMVRRIEYMRNAEGFVTNKVYRRDSSGVAAADGQGVSQVTFDLLQDGRIAARRNLDWQGRPVTDKNGVHLVRYSYDGSRLSRIQYCGLDEKRLRDLGHEDERVYVYSPHGNLTRIEKMKGGRTLEKVLYERGAGGDVAKETYFWDEGVKHSKPWTARAIHFDDGGNVIRETFFDSEMRRWRRVDKRIATIERKFSNAGDLIEEAYFDEDGKLMLGADGWAKRTFRHECSSDGTVIWRRYFNEDDNSFVLPSDGFACDKKSFDVYGRIIDWELFGTNDVKVNGALGWHRMTPEYGRDGKLIARRFYDKSEKLIEEEKEDVAKKTDKGD